MQINFSDGANANEEITSEIEQVNKDLESFISNVDENTLSGTIIVKQCAKCQNVLPYVAIVVQLDMRENSDIIEDTPIVICNSCLVLLTSF